MPYACVSSEVLKALTTDLSTVSAHQNNCDPVLLVCLAHWCDIVRRIDNVDSQLDLDRIDLGGMAAEDKGRCSRSIALESHLAVRVDFEPAIVHFGRGVLGMRWDPGRIRCDFEGVRYTVGSPGCMTFGLSRSLAIVSGHS